MSSPDAGEPIWTRLEPGARRAGHTRESIARAAIAIADAEGLRAVSMRRLATELGAGTMTLYHYVRTKDELLALIDDAIMGELLVPTDELPAGWRDALAEIARRTRAVWLHHPWMRDLRPDGQTGPNALRHLEQSLVAAARAGLDEEGQLELILLVDDYVFGYVARAGQQRDGERDPDFAEKMEGLIAYLETELATGDYPHMQAMAGDDTRATFTRLTRLASDEQRFERGLQILLDGVALDLERRL